MLRALPEPPTEIEFVGVCTGICVISNAMLCKAAFPEANIVIDAALCACVTPESHDTAPVSYTHLDVYKRQLANSTGKAIADNPNGNGYDLKANYDKIAKLSEVPCLQEGGSGQFLVLINSKAQIHAIIYHSDRGYLGLYFSDTNQYSAYKIGETAEGGKMCIRDRSSICAAFSI